MKPKYTDMNGREIKPGDVVKLVEPDFGAVYASPYAMYYINEYGDETELRDLRINDKVEYYVYSGHWTQHLDELSCDLKECFGIDIDRLKDNGVTELIVNGVKII